MNFKCLAPERAGGTPWCGGSTRLWSRLVSVMTAGAGSPVEFSIGAPDGVTARGESGHPSGCPPSIS